MARATYDTYGKTYTATRRTDPRTEARVREALGDARSVVNVGAGTGSYEPDDRFVVAVEPSVEMVSQRPADAAPAVRAVAESLCFRDGSFDASLAVLTIHHWGDWRAGLDEMRRVSDSLVVLTFDPEMLDHFWLTQEYLPEIVDLDRKRIPAVELVVDHLGGADVTVLPVPHDCVDGHLGAFWRRPEAYLDPLVRAGMSPFHMLDLDAGIKRLARDIEDGRWDELFGELRQLTELDLGYRLVVSSSSSR